MGIQKSFANCETIIKEMIVISAKKLEDVRNEKGLTQEQMAAMLSIAVSTYNQYENGTRSVPASIAEKISDILNVDVYSIFLPKKFTVSKT